MVSKWYELAAAAHRLRFGLEWRWQHRWCAVHSQLGASFCQVFRGFHFESRGKWWQERGFGGRDCPLHFSFAAVGFGYLRLKVVFGLGTGRRGVSLVLRQSSLNGGAQEFQI
jgi:hypothetical protein